MAAHTRTRHERTFDLGRIVRWYRAGTAPSEIARRLGLSKQLVNYDLRQLEHKWAEARIMNMAEAKAVELERLDAVRSKRGRRSRRLRLKSRHGTAIAIWENDDRHRWRDGRESSISRRHIELRRKARQDFEPVRAVADRNSSRRQWTPAGISSRI